MADEVVQHYLYNVSSTIESPCYDTFIKDGDTTNPIIAGIMYPPVIETTVTPGDYCNVGYPFNSETKDPVVPGFNNNPLYVYTLNSDWKYVGGQYNRVGCNFIHNCAGDSELTLANGDNFEGSTCDEVIIKPKDGNTIYRSHIKNTNFYEYAVYEREEDEYYEASEVFTTTSATIKVTPGDGISAIIPNNIYSDLDYGIYQYPGIWVRGSEYPKLDIPIPEPKYKGHVQLKWTDPPDITDWKPTPATWEGTVIVRKENSAPLHRWDGDKVVRTTTRDKYKSKPYKDEDIETNKVYYYAFMPYYTKIDDPQHPIRYYTFTKCIRVETGTISYIPEIIKIDMDEDVATITYAITLPATGPYDTAILYGKKDGNPACDNTDDIVLDISQVDDQVVVPDIDGDYFFCIQVANGTDTFTSDVVSCSGNGPVPPEYDYIKHAGTYNVKVIDANHGEHYYDLTEVPFIWNRSQLNNPFNKNLPFTLFYPGEQFYNWYYSTITGIRFYDTATINLTKESNDSYTASYTGFNYKQGISLNNGYNYVNSHGWEFESEIGDYLYVSDWSEQTQPATMTTSFNSLSEALTYIEQHFRHVNLYVDGTLWVRAN